MASEVTNQWSDATSLVLGELQVQMLKCALHIYFNVSFLLTGHATMCGASKSKTFILGYQLQK
jgi:hypothetical protein